MLSNVVGWEKSSFVRFFLILVSTTLVVHNLCLIYNSKRLINTTEAIVFKRFSAKI